METSKRNISELEAPSSVRRSFVVLSWVLVAAWAGFIFFMSAHTSSGLDEDMGLISQLLDMLKAWQRALFDPDADIVSSLGHFCEYFVFGALVANALRCHMPLRRVWPVALALASAYGITDELHQLFVPTRTCDPVDWVVDTVAAALAVTLVCAIFGRRRRAVADQSQ